MHKRYFYLEKVKNAPGRVRIRCRNELMNVDTGAWLEVLPARLLGLQYDEYLIFCKQNFNASIIGRQSLYPYPTFYRDEILRKFVKLLNFRLEYIMMAKENKNANHT
jgi:hypothetical protein